jgi:aldehyde:ferredoxin oxidoreductase
LLTSSSPYSVHASQQTVLRVEKNVWTPMSTPALVRSNDIPTTNIPQSETLGPEDIKLNSSSVATLKVNFLKQQQKCHFPFRC